MANFSIRTATDPDLGRDEGLNQHTLATETFQRILWALCKAAGVFDNDHERAYNLYQRAAFDTALELGCELRIEDKDDETEITFDFVGTVTFIEVPEDLPPTGENKYDPAAEFAAAITPESEWDLDTEITVAEAEDAIAQAIVDLDHAGV